MDAAFQLVGTGPAAGALLLVRDVELERRERVPIIANTQDYRVLAEELTAVLAQNPAVHGVLLSGHGLYTWGTSVAEARRHVEALEFLFEVEWRRLTDRLA